MFLPPDVHYRQKTQQVDLPKDRRLVPIINYTWTHSIIKKNSPKTKKQHKDISASPSKMSP